ncbi:hypothetical protein KC323_g43 [Hortaea werneckii]|nr:hypothetical protein KC323_g43 [Hortaea werneckii]
MRNVAVRAKPRLRVGSEASHDPRTLTRLTSCQYPRWYDITVHAVPKSLIWPYRLQAFPRSHLPPSAFESCKAASCEVEYPWFYALAFEVAPGCTCKRQYAAASHVCARCGRYKVAHLGAPNSAYGVGGQLYSAM